ncbi:MAG: Dabb family protein [Bacteroidota bacterium]|nr:Dabb family protein [Bacteroidota bacterium]
MIKHVVMIKLSEIDNNEERNEMAIEILNRLDKLPELIKEIEGYDTGQNIKSSESANFQDLVLVSDFENIKEMEIYKNHPDHVKVVEFIKNVGGEFTSVDYEY